MAPIFLCWVYLSYFTTCRNLIYLNKIRSQYLKIKKLNLNSYLKQKYILKQIKFKLYHLRYNLPTTIWLFFSEYYSPDPGTTKPISFFYCQEYYYSPVQVPNSSQNY